MASSTHRLSPYFYTLKITDITGDIALKDHDEEIAVDKVIQEYETAEELDKFADGAEKRPAVRCEGITVITKYDQSTPPILTSLTEGTQIAEGVLSCFNQYKEIFLKIEFKNALVQRADVYSEPEGTIVEVNFAYEEITHTYLIDSKTATIFNYSKVEIKTGEAEDVEFPVYDPSEKGEDIEIEERSPEEREPEEQETEEAEAEEEETEEEETEEEEEEAEEEEEEAEEEEEEAEEEEEEEAEEEEEEAEEEEEEAEEEEEEEAEEEEEEEAEEEEEVEKAEEDTVVYSKVEEGDDDEDADDDVGAADTDDTDYELEDISGDEARLDDLGAESEEEYSGIAIDEYPELGEEEEGVEEDKRDDKDEDEHPEEYDEFAEQEYELEEEAVVNIVSLSPVVPFDQKVMVNLPSSPGKSYGRRIAFEVKLDNKDLNVPLYFKLISGADNVTDLLPTEKGGIDDSGVTEKIINSSRGKAKCDLILSTAGGDTFKLQVSLDDKATQDVKQSAEYTTFRKLYYQSTVMKGLQDLNFRYVKEEYERCFIDIEQTKVVQAPHKANLETADLEDPKGYQKYFSKTKSPLELHAVFIDKQWDSMTLDASSNVSELEVSFPLGKEVWPFDDGWLVSATWRYNDGSAAGEGTTKPGDSAEYTEAKATLERLQNEAEAMDLELERLGDNLDRLPGDDAIVRERDELVRQGYSTNKDDPDQDKYNRYLRLLQLRDIWNQKVTLAGQIRTIEAKLKTLETRGQNAMDAVLNLQTFKVSATTLNGNSTIKVDFSDFYIPPTHEAVEFTLELKAVKGKYGGDASFRPHNFIALGKPETLQGYSMAVIHEMGHAAFEMTPKADHDLQYSNANGGSGSHCRHGATPDKKSLDQGGDFAGKYTGGKCVMYHASSEHYKFCPTCKPHVLKANLDKANMKKRKW